MAFLLAHRRGYGSICMISRGLALTLATLVLWAALPLGLALALQAVDAYTLTWFRFAVAALLLGVWLQMRGQLSPLRGLRPSTYAWLLLASAGLIGNYLLYVLGLERISPAATQLLIQSAPLLLAIGGWWWFAEPLGRRGAIGLLLAALGLLLFCIDRGAFSSASGFGPGAALVLAAAVVWVAYALAQKRLLAELRSPVILWVIYLLASLVLWPLVDWTSLGAVRGLGLLALLFCALNTVAAYGAFAEAMAHWPASRIGAVLTLSPLATLLLVWLASGYAPQYFEPEGLGLGGWLGALVTVIGAALVSLGKQPVNPPVNQSMKRPNPD